MFRKASIAMSVLQYETYVEKLKSSQQDYKAETLRIQRKFLYSVYSHHRLWANHTDDTEAARNHNETADLLQKIIDQYDQLLERYYLDNARI
jgi:hypothetical protein